MLKLETAAFDALAPWLTEARWIASGHPEAAREPGALGHVQRAAFHVARRIGRPVRRSGGFVAHCLRVADPGIALPDDPGAAQSWHGWGLDCAPQIGAVALLRAGDGADPVHVGFYVAEDEGAFHVLGGPRPDSVSVGRHAKAHLVGFRWPEGQRQTGQRLTAPPEYADPA